MAEVRRYYTATRPTTILGRLYDPAGINGPPLAWLLPKQALPYL